MDIRIDLAFTRHPKTIELERIVGPYGPWCLIRLWCWVAAYRPDGDLSGYGDVVLEEVSGYYAASLFLAGNRDPLPDGFVSILLRVGFIEGEPCERKIHDWGEWQPHVLLVAKRREAGRKGGKSTQEKIRSRRPNSSKQPSKIKQPRKSASSPLPLPLPESSESSTLQTPVRGVPPVTPLLPPTSADSSADEFTLTPGTGKARALRDQWADRFRDFYDPYPRHVNPAAAKRAWAKHCPPRAYQIDGKVARIVALLEKHKAKLWINPELAKPYPASWLNNQEFPDETPSTPVPSDQASSGSLRPSGGGADDQDARRRARAGAGGGDGISDPARRP